MIQPVKNPLVRIYLFGDFRIEKNSEALPLRHSKARSLFAFLLRYPQKRHLREQLADLLWPEAPPERVGRNLSDALYRLRQVLGDDLLHTSRDAIMLNPDADLWVDVWAFTAGVSVAERAAWEQAASLYAGPLLPDSYEDWVLQWRTRLQEQFVDCLLRLGSWAEQQHLPDRAHHYFQQLVQQAPLREVGHRGLMRSLAALGRFTEAFAVYDALAALLTQEMALEPDAETQRLFAQLQAEWQVVQQPPDSAEWKRPFVGRTTERAALIDALDAARQGRGCVIAIEGEAGMGKSRLLAEIERSAAWRQMSVIAGSAAAYTAVSPFSPLTDSLAAAIQGPRVAQLETMVAGETLAAAAVLHEAWQPLARLPDLPVEAAHKRFFMALTTICQTLTTLSPHVLVLDDVHWAGPDFWQALDALVPMLQQSRLLLLLAYRRSEMETQTAWQLLEKWERAGQLRIMSLAALNQADVAQLLPPSRQSEVDAVLAGTGGNPYYVTEVLYSMAHGGAAYRETAVSRAAALPPETQIVLQVAAVIGSQVPYRLWAEIVPVSPVQLARISEQLVNHYLLEAAGDGYQFTHELVREAIHAQTEPAQRQAFHRAVAAALAVQDAAQMRARAFHLEAGGETAAAAALYRDIGAANMAAFAFADAVFAFDRALTLAESQPIASTLAMYLQLIRACEVTGDLTRQASALQDALPLAEAANDMTFLIPLLMEQGYYDIKQGEFAGGEAHLQRALALAAEAEDVAAQGEIQQHLGDLALRLGENMQAVGYFETAVSLARQTNNPALEGRSLEGIGYALSQHSHPLTEVVPYFERSIALHRQCGNPLGEALTLVNYFSVLQNAGAWDRVLHMADTVIAAQQAIHYRRGEAIAYQAYGVAAMQLGDHELAADCLQRALTGFDEVGEPLGATIARMSLGTVAERQGEQAQAAVFYEAALADAQQLGAAMFVAFVQQSWGGMLVEMEEWETAVPLLQSAIQIWIDQSDRNFQLRCEALLGLAYMGVGKCEQAAELAYAGWTALQELDAIHGEERELWLWALAQLCRQCGLEAETAVLVRAAYDELQKQAHVIADPVICHRFFAQVPPNRAIVQAYDTQEKIERTQQIRLAHKDAPLGRALTPAEMVAVQWTLQAPEDEAILNKTERRRTQLKRLLTEAAAQNAMPTDDDLAAALNVSRRTILRDMQALAAGGSVWQTRGRG